MLVPIGRLYSWIYNILDTLETTRTCRERLITTLETNPKYIVVEAVLAEINPEQSLETITEEKEDNEASEHTKKFPLIPRFSFLLPLFTS